MSLLKLKGINIRRFYWIIVISFLCLMLYDIVLKLYDAFKTRSLTFTVDTTYLNWNTSFPAISICEIFNGEKIWDLNEKHFGTNRDKNQDDFISDIAFFNGNCHSCKLCDKNLDCPNNFTEILEKFRTSCENLITECMWNNEFFDCCKAFLPLRTEFGICFTINCVQTIPKYGKRLISNRITGPGSLQLVALEDIQIHIHSPDDIPLINGDRNLHETILWGLKKEIILSAVEIFNDGNVQDIPISQRRCRFSWEELNDDTMKFFDFYSYSTCAVQCHARAQITLCNCTAHMMPQNKKNFYNTCDYIGLTCLTDNFNKLAHLRRECQCLASCEEPEYNVIYSSEDFYGEEIGSQIKVSMVDIPKTRFIRNTVRTTLDFVISLGGIAGLFFGASILSIIEYISILNKRASYFLKKIIDRWEGSKFLANINTKKK